MAEHSRLCGQLAVVTQALVGCVTKHAVEGLVKAMAVELAPHAIRVNAVAPTFVETPMSRPFLTDAVLLAATRELMTGASPAVDGGWTAR
jgi:NAD(P)-dependent dehydrogenase (short-subunit alcohol dehydrogenase family)